MIINNNFEEPYNKFPPEGSVPILSKTIIKSKLSSKFSSALQPIEVRLTGSGSNSNPLTSSNQKSSNIQTQSSGALKEKLQEKPELQLQEQEESPSKGSSVNICLSQDKQNNKDAVKSNFNESNFGNEDFNIEDYIIKLSQQLSQMELPERLLMLNNELKKKIEQLTSISLEKDAVEKLIIATEEEIKKKKSIKFNSTVVAKKDGRTLKQPYIGKASTNQRKR